jgi:hypothetical protein
VSKILRNIFSQVCQQELPSTDIWDEGKLIDAIREVLKNKRYIHELRMGIGLLVLHHFVFNIVAILIVLSTAVELNYIDASLHSECMQLRIVFWFTICVAMFLEGLKTSFNIGTP